MSQKERSKLADSLKQGIEEPNIKSFKKIYSELLVLLKSIDFSILDKNTKVSKTNYESRKKKTNKNMNSESDITAISKHSVEIEKYLQILSRPEYVTFLDQIKIPSRSSQPDFSNLSSEEMKLKKEEYNKLEKDEESTIKLMTYINELVKQYQVYHNHDIRKYYINLCSLILLMYSRTHPLEVASIHFRFKSTKGLIVKLAQRIIIDGKLHRDPETGKDTLMYRDISDAFGAKLVVSKGFNPRTASSDENIQKLINERNSNYKNLEPFEALSERIDNYVNGEDIESITYLEYYDTCLNLLEALLSVINENETEYREAISKKIAIIQSEKDQIDITGNLSDYINDPDFFQSDVFNFQAYLAKYNNAIDSPLAIAGIKKFLNRIFDGCGLSQQNLLEKSILERFNIRKYKHEEKHTSSGHEGIHIDIMNPFGKFELQAQTESQYISDRIDETNAHSLMNNKDVPLFQIPTRISEEAFDSNKVDEYISITLPNGNCVYLSKNTVSSFIENVENITAHKGKITYNKALNDVQVELYDSLYNYMSLAMEIPDNHPNKPSIDNYFTRLSEIRKSISKYLFHHPNPIVQHLKLSQIRSYILGVSKTLPETPNDARE